VPDTPVCMNSHKKAQKTQNERRYLCVLFVLLCGKDWWPT
jgi:hypothetical protein